MNGIENTRLLGERRADPVDAVFLLLLTPALCLVGCTDQVRAPSRDQLAAFEKAGTITPSIDVDRIRMAQLRSGPYRVVPGDVLEFTMPAVVQAVTASELQNTQTLDRLNLPYVCRVGVQGTITLPAVGEVKVANQSLAEIEQSVANACRPFIMFRPPIFVRVLEYRTSKVPVTGAVDKPGLYTLRSDQMTVLSLLTEAGGIAETGAAVIRIVKAGNGGAPSNEKTANGSNVATVTEHELTEPASASERELSIALPVSGVDTPFHDVALEEGDAVVVEQAQVPLFSVLGLVSRPGNFPYPATVKYNLAQAIAFAGGLDVVADPRYATIYRLDENGAVLRVPLKLIEKDEFTNALNTQIRPGDVVAVENTPRTRWNTAIHNLLRINTGVYVTGNDIWSRD